MLIQTYQLQEPNAAMKFHDGGALNNVRNDHDGGGRSVRVNDEYHDGDYDVHRVRVNSDKNHGGD